MRQETEISDKEATSSRWQLACLAVIIISGLIYLPAMKGMAVWDDHALIGGSGIGGGDTLYHCFSKPFLFHYFRPLVSVSFFIDHKLFGSGAIFYHQTNILIHVLTTGVLIGLLSTVFNNRKIAIVGALLFAVQPVQVSTVGWIGGRTDSLCTLWMAIFSWTVILGAKSEGRNRIIWLSTALLTFVAALLTKEQVVATLPLVWLSFKLFAPDEKKAVFRQGVWATAPFFVASVIFIALWISSYPNSIKPAPHSIPYQFSLAGRTIWYYALLFIMPTSRLMSTMTTTSFEQSGGWTVAAGYAVLLGYIALFVRWMRISKGCAWFAAYIALSMLAICNFMPLPSIVVASYRVGISGLGEAALAGAGFVWLSEYLIRIQFSRVRALTASKIAVWGLCGGYLIWCGGLTLWGIDQWKDDFTIFSTITRYDPNCLHARQNLITAYTKNNQMPEAARELEALLTNLYGTTDWKDKEKALAAVKRSDFILEHVRNNVGGDSEPIAWMASLHAQLGSLYLEDNKTDEARYAFQTGLMLHKLNADANLGMAQMAFGDKDYKLATRYMHISIASNPDLADSHKLFSRLLIAEQRWLQARSEIKIWTSLQPWISEPYLEMAEVETHLGNYSDAKVALEYALKHTVCNPQVVRERLIALQNRSAKSI